MTVRYCSVNLVRQYLGITATTDDDLIGTLIDSAVDAINTHTHRLTFAAISDTSRTFDAYRDTQAGGDYRNNGFYEYGYGRRVQTFTSLRAGYARQTLYLDEDLYSITSITNGDGTTVTSSEYTTEPRNVAPYYAISLLPSASIAWEPNTNGDPENAITITGRWGYSETPPGAIVQACMRLAAFYYRQKDAQLQDVTAIEAGVVLAPVGIPADVVRILAPYVKRVGNG